MQCNLAQDKLVNDLKDTAEFEFRVSHIWHGYTLRLASDMNVRQQWQFDRFAIMFLRLFNVDHTTIGPAAINRFLLNQLSRFTKQGSCATSEVLIHVDFVTMKPRVHLQLEPGREHDITCFVVGKSDKDSGWGRIWWFLYELSRWATDISSTVRGTFSFVLTISRIALSVDKLVSASAYHQNLQRQHPNSQPTVNQQWSSCPDGYTAPVSQIWRKPLWDHFTTFWHLLSYVYFRLWGVILFATLTNFSSNQVTKASSTRSSLGARIRSLTTTAESLFGGIFKCFS